MAKCMPAISFPDDEAFTAEEQRLGELFARADQLADDRVAQDAFLQSLTQADRQEIVAALVHANALRMMGSETVPSLQGRARQRLQEAIQAHQHRQEDVQADWTLRDTISSLSSRNTS